MRVLASSRWSVDVASVRFYRPADLASIAGRATQTLFPRQIDAAARTPGTPETAMSRDRLDVSGTRARFATAKQNPALGQPARSEVGA